MTGTFVLEIPYDTSHMTHQKPRWLHLTDAESVDRRVSRSLLFRDSSVYTHAFVCIEIHMYTCAKDKDKCMCMYMYHVYTCEKDKDK